MSGKCPETIFDQFVHVTLGGYSALLSHCAAVGDREGRKRGKEMGQRSTVMASTDKYGLRNFFPTLNCVFPLENDSMTHEFDNIQRQNI